MPVWVMDKGKITVQVRPGKKFSKSPISTNKLFMVVHTCTHRYMKEGPWQKAGQVKK
jgi:hypothetical protein